MHMSKVVIVAISIVVILLIFGLFLPALFHQRANRSVRLSPSSQESSAPSPTSGGKTTTQVRLFFIALEDAGKAGKVVGCGDSLVSVVRTVPETNTPLQAAYEQLLSLHDQYYGQSGLYNSLYQSHLRLESATIDSHGAANIRLSGTPTLSGECDNPRFKAQLEAVALQFPTVKQVSITISGKKLDDIVSSK
jgi:hypothetical protein